MPFHSQHITRRSTPQAIETGDATQELNQIHGMRAPYGNGTYKDKMLRGDWEKEIKETIYKAQSARKKAGTEGKVRSDVYKDDRRKIEDYLNNGYKGIDRATALAGLEDDALHNNELGSIRYEYGGRTFQANGKEYVLSKRADGTWKVKELGKTPRYAATNAKKSAQNAKTTSNPVQGKASGSFSAKDAMGKLNKLATTLNNGGGHPFDDWRQARDILEKAPVGTTITAQLNRGAKSVHIKKADGKWTNDSGAPYDTNTMSKYWYKGNNDIPEVDIYTPDMGKGSTRTPTLKEALKEKAGKKTRKK